MVLAGLYLAAHGLHHRLRPRRVPRAHQPVHDGGVRVRVGRHAVRAHAVQPTARLIHPPRPRQALQEGH